MADMAPEVATTGEEVVGEEVAMTGGKRNKWLTHVKKTLKAHKGKSFKAVLKLAKKTYKGGAALSPLPLNGGKRRKTRRGARRH